MGSQIDEVTDLLQHLIRNACVNDGTRDSGQEHRNVEVLRSYLEGTGCDIEVREPVDGRPSLVARWPGSDPDAPSLMLMGHTDVVPANPDTWDRDPFGGDLVDGFVWGRGAVDMFNLTSSMAVACKRLMSDGFAPRGDLVYFAVADEEAGGEHGAKWYVHNEPDQVRTDYVLTEFGGMRLALPGRETPALAVGVAEKGPFWGRISVTGTPGHASLPYRSDNALVTAAEVVRRLAEHRPPAVITDTWRTFVAGLEYDEEVAALMTDPQGVDEALEDIEDLGMARFVHGCTHMTIAPTMAEAGVKSNVIPGEASVSFDVRVLPGQGLDDVEGELRAALGDLADAVTWEFQFAEVGTSSPVDTPLWDILQKRSAELVPGAVNVPFTITGATDSRFLRELGNTCYGYGLYSERIPLAEFAAMFHGNNERIDQESLDLSTDLWQQVVRDLLG